MIIPVYVYVHVSSSFSNSIDARRHDTLASTEEKMMTAKPRTMTDMMRSPTFRAKTSIPSKKSFMNSNRWMKYDEIAECLDLFIQEIPQSMSSENKLMSPVCVEV